ncbi:RNA-binding protein 43-like [Acipenser oxyrinchus oxyrinchus]|uniref:RNA-binding protein 43-like n=1 Tax=Acipenser oxyrinchus oxyrinchus TaxID=40147 RepID=A0AAD8GDK3_ACIOX|nr:RNA-binding protein 43-like [Acipenser oxyrinchus oxyrinchus]
MAADRCTLQVLQVPSVLPDDRMIDKLLIHFLRPRNGGGEVLGVRYPTDTPAEALVTFEQEEVADRVLQRSQVLELQSGKHPLKVRRVESEERIEVDMPMRTHLSLEMFPDQGTVRELLEKHSFRVTQLQGGPPGKLQIEGSFTELRKLRTELYTLLPAAPRDIRGPPASRYLHTADGAQGLENSTGARHNRVNDSGTGAISKTKFSNSPGDRNDPQSRGERRTKALLVTLPLSPQANQTPRKAQRVSFNIDKHVLKYAKAFHKQDMSEILDSHCVEMSEEESDEISTVILTSVIGLDSPASILKVAEELLSSLLFELGRTLRTQKINLSSYDRQQQSQILERSNMLKNIYKVLVIGPDGGSIQLVGPSNESYELKLRLLGQAVNSSVGEQLASNRQGRRMDRGDIRRSSSLPRQPSRTDLRSPMEGSLSAQQHSPEKYQLETAGCGRAGGHLGVTGLEKKKAGSTPSPNNKEKSLQRKRASSETRGKTKERQQARIESSRETEREPPSGQGGLGVESDVKLVNHKQNKNMPALLKNMTTFSDKHLKIFMRKKN